MTYDVSFGRWLQQRRKKLGLTQEQLGDLLNYSGAMIRKIEADERRPSRQEGQPSVDAIGAHHLETLSFQRELE